MHVEHLKHVVIGAAIGSALLVAILVAIVALLMRVKREHRG
jgi:hypothetical protein